MTTTTTNANTTSPSKFQPTKTGNSQENPVDMTDSAPTSANAGDKRKAPSANTTTTTTTEEAEEEGGKDLVEKKQTTLDDIVSSEHQKQPTEAKISAPESNESKKDGEKDKEEDRPAKKSKIENDEEGKVEGKEEKEGKVDSSSSSKSDSKSDDKAKSTDKSTPAQKETNGTSTSKDTTTTASKTETAKSADDKIEVDDTPIQTPAAPTSTSNANLNDKEETVPGDEAHLDHPENWTTGADPATDKQKGFLKVLEKQKGVPVGDISDIGKSEASEKIDELKNM